MKSTSNRIIVTGIVFGGLSYWFQPYNQQELFGVNIYILMAAGAFMGSFILAMVMATRPVRVAKLIAFGILISVMGRIAYDMILHDSTSHNLMPFEIGISLIVSVPASLLGAYITLLFKSNQSEQDDK